MWLPGSAVELASVGDDSALLFWDTRDAQSPAARVPDAHGPALDLHCVDWSAMQQHLVATGALLEPAKLKAWFWHGAGSLPYKVHDCTNNIFALDLDVRRPHQRTHARPGDCGAVHLLWRAREPV